MDSKEEIRNNRLQELCRDFLERLRPIARKFGLEGFIDETIELNRQDKCRGTEDEVELLSRCIDEERIGRLDVQKTLGLSYRHCFDNDLFDRVKKLRHVGIYSKVDAELFKAELDAEGK